MLAHELGMSIDECMSKHTERQKDMWMLWLQRNMDRPDRGDHYLMANTAVLHDILALLPGKRAKATDPNQLKIKFKFKRRGPLSEAEKRMITEHAKAAWAMRTGSVK